MPHKFLHILLSKPAVAPEFYVPMLKSTQEASVAQLWAGVIQCHINLCDPIEPVSRIHDYEFLARESCHPGSFRCQLADHRAHQKVIRCWFSESRKFIEHYYCGMCLSYVHTRYSGPTHWSRGTLSVQSEHAISSTRIQAFWDWPCLAPSSPETDVRFFFFFFSIAHFNLLIRLLFRWRRLGLSYIFESVSNPVFGPLW